MFSRLEGVKDSFQVSLGVLGELHILTRCQFFIRDSAIFNPCSFELKLVIVAKVPQDGPACLLLHLSYEYSLQRLECLKVDHLLRLRLVILFRTAFVDEDLLESSDVFVLQFSLENISLELPKLIVVEVAILVLVADPKYPLQGSLILGLQLLIDRIKERRDGVEHGSLSAVDNVDEVHVSFGRALDSHLNLLVL
jgi:hypothetical protein